MIHFKELGLILIFVAYTLGDGEYCSVDQHCERGEVCEDCSCKQDRSVVSICYAGVKICMKVWDQICKKPCKSHRDCRWYLGKYCDKKEGICKRFFG